MHQGVGPLVPWSWATTTLRTSSIDEGLRKEAWRGILRKREFLAPPAWADRLTHGIAPRASSARSTLGWGSQPDSVWLIQMTCVTPAWVKNDTRKNRVRRQEGALLDHRFERSLGAPSKKESGSSSRVHNKGSNG